ncbi:MAG: hypothetical protein C4521_02770 [Actinobacteria bacterium]|nr:MAG: hypothetical protein C4521_02770 [Actinomycetota bacterium]
MSGDIIVLHEFNDLKLVKDFALRWEDTSKGVVKSVRIPEELDHLVNNMLAKYADVLPYRNSSEFFREAGGILFSTIARMEEKDIEELRSAAEAAEIEARMNYNAVQTKRIGRMIGNTAKHVEAVLKEGDLEEAATTISYFLNASMKLSRYWRRKYLTAFRDNEKLMGAYQRLRDAGVKLPEIEED